MRYRLWIRSLAANLAIAPSQVRKHYGDVVRLFRAGFDPLAATDSLLGNR